MQGRGKVVLLLQLLPIYLLSSFNKVRYIDYLKGGIRGWTKGQIARKVQVGGGGTQATTDTDFNFYDGYEDLSEGDLCKRFQLLWSFSKNVKQVIKYPITTLKV